LFGAQAQARSQEATMSKLHFESLRVVPFAVAVALAGASSPGSALVVDLSLSASDFVGKTGAGPTLELPPQEEVTASFTVSTDGVRDVPDVVSPGIENGVEYEVLSVYTTPTAGQIEIVGYSYPLSDLAAYLGFVDGRLSQVLLSGRAEFEPGGGPAACIATATTNDFILNVNIGPSPSGEPETPPMFVYTTDATASGFFADSLHVTMSLDSGPPLEFVVNPPLEGAIACKTAKPIGGEADLAGVAKPGDRLCEPAGDASLLSGLPASPSGWRSPARDWPCPSSPSSPVRRAS
jgi:hypothetical protein